MTPRRAHSGGYNRAPATVLPGVSVRNPQNAIVTLRIAGVVTRGRRATAFGARKMNISDQRIR